MLTRKFLFGLAIALLSTTSLVAQDDMKAKKALDRVKKTLTANVMKSFAKVELTDEQKAQATAVVDKHVDKFAAAKKAQDSVLTKDHMASRKAALEKAMADGVKKKDAHAAANEAMGLTEEQKASYAEAKKKANSVVASIRTEIVALLTDEQKAAMPSKGKGKGKGKKGKKKTEETSATQAVSLKLPNMT